MRSKVGIAVRFAVLYAAGTAVTTWMGNPADPVACAALAAVLAWLCTPIKIKLQTESFRKPF